MLKRVFGSVPKLLVIMVYVEMVCCELPCEQVVSSNLPCEQINAMTKIYEIIQRDTTPNFRWNNVVKNSDPCSWQGVGCSPNNHSINHISFKYFSISTTEFLPFLCNITTLESLDLSHNHLTSIPEGFYTDCGKISGLKFLDFSVNDVNASLLTFNGFTALEHLDFSANLFSGEIHLQLHELISLKILNLGWNYFQGRIPTNLGKMMNSLEELHLDGDNFTGAIPAEITNYKNLRVIDLTYNELSGSIPVEFKELTRLQTFVLSENHLSSGIPAWLANITTLERFEANHNKFSGTVPPGIASHLAFLDLSNNKLMGSIPSDLLSGPYLQTLKLSDNELEGPIPAINSTTLSVLLLGHNCLNGTLPSVSFGGLRQKLELHNNRLGGSLPPALGNLTNLEVLRLEFNDLVGEIPLEISQLNRLESLNMGRNSLNGSIPLSISRMQRIRNLDLQGNNLHGYIPNSIANLSSLTELQLGSNKLNGPIPLMPVALRISLNLSYNLFDGPIPYNLSRLRSLQVLDLSNNRFSGKIPSFLTELSSLTRLLLMNNELNGVVPKFEYYVEVVTSGNEDLIDEPTPPPHRNTTSIDSDLVIAVASGFPVGLLISVIAIFISTKYNSIIHGNLSPPNSIHNPNVDFKEGMEAVADPSNIILKTASSTFYKVVMPSSCTTYLVKKINHSRNIFHFPRHKELAEELEIVGSLSNPNVMIPVAYVLTPRRAYLFYDFVRGTLYDVLHHRTGSKLDWPSRYTIAVGVSKGLAFLHECSSGPIILLDLCSRSILLKSLEEPQIGDIELCMLIHPSNSGAASVGYAPPEYGCTAAGNVYSFGVVLLELLTGKPAVFGGTELAQWVLSISGQRNRWHQILDSSVSETSVGVRKQMVAVVEVALACISISPEARPNTITVLQMLLSRRLYS